MRTIVTDRETDLEALSRRIAVAGKSQVVADELRRLNPHADLNDLPQGTVLLVEDEAPIERKMTQGAELGPLGEVVAQLQPLIDGAVAQTVARVTDRARENKSVADALKLASMKRAIAVDPLIMKRADTFVREAKAARAQSDAAVKALKELQIAARGESERLAKLAR